jgi:serine/threonine-protein kinase
MEYVEGRPITEWCAARRATLEERLELFGAVCAAAQHAHANLVVHRDLKPGNILVSQGGEVKLLDFGIARLLSGDGHDPGMTLTGGPLRVMTPQYAAPELVAGEPATTATDVYGLGLVLFELLAGQRAYRLEGMTPDELRRTLLEAEVEPPSRVVTRAAQGTGAQRVAAATETAGLRSTTQERLARRLRGDLDTIALTALRKEPERRYASVEALVEDLRRWEADLPIRARPAGRAYRLRKLMARHRVAMVAVGVGLVIVLAYAVTASVLLRRAELAARRATRIQEFLTQVLGAAGPEHIGTGFEVLGSSNPEAPVREALDRAADRVDQRFADDPEVLAAVHHVIGETYLSLGLYDRAELHVRRAMTLRERHREGSDYLESLNMLAIVLNRQGRNEEALALAGRVVRLDRRLQGAEASEVAIALQSEAAILNAMGRYDEAVERTSEGLRILRAHARPGDPRLIEVLNALASSRVGQGRFAEAESLQREVLGLVTRVYGPESRRYATALSNLGTSVYQQERYAEAESLRRSVLALRRRHLGAEHPDIATTLNGLAMAIRNQGRYAEADSLFVQAIAMRTRLLGPDHRDVLVSLSAYANLLKERGEYARAESLHRNVLARRLRVMGPDHPLVGSSLHSLGETLERERKYAAAESAYVAALALRGRILRPDHPDTRRTRESLAKLYEVWKKPERAAAVRAATSGGR